MRLSTFRPRGLKKNRIGGIQSPLFLVDSPPSTHNQLRGDASSIAAHRLSMKTVGLLQDLDGEPFFIQSDAEGEEDVYLCCHFASRIEALTAEYEADTSQSCKPVPHLAAQATSK